MLTESLVSKPEENQSREAEFGRTDRQAAWSQANGKQTQCRVMLVEGFPGNPYSAAGSPGVNAIFRLERVEQSVDLMWERQHHPRWLEGGQDRAGNTWIRSSLSKTARGRSLSI